MPKMNTDHIYIIFEQYISEIWTLLRYSHLWSQITQNCNVETCIFYKADLGQVPLHYFKSYFSSRWQH